MRFNLISAALAALCFALPTTAQKVQVFGGNGQRAASTMILFGQDMMAGLTINHGQPEWKDQYTGMMDKLKGKTNRLGKDLWTTFMTSTPVEIGGAKVMPGCYCVGLHCDNDGKFSLAMIDSTKAMKKGLMPFGPQNWKPEVVVPMKLNMNASKESQKKMLMTLKANKDNPMTGMFTLAWGPHTLTADVKVHKAAKK